MVPKSNNTLHFYNDYREVSSVTNPDSFLLPRMEDCIDKVDSDKFITKLEADLSASGAVLQEGN